MLCLRFNSMQLSACVRLGLLSSGLCRLVCLSPDKCARSEHRHDDWGGLTVEVKAGVLDGGGEAEAALVLAAEGDSGRLPIQADAEALQLMLNQLLVGDGLQAVQHDQDEIARPGCTDDLQGARRGKGVSP